METRRYETLDALRGVAALAVIGHHLGLFKMEPGLMPRGYLAVDFFFVLSGFVVAYAYEGALRNGLSWRAFLVKRLIRLYPLALLGAALGIMVLLETWWNFFPGETDSLRRILASGALNCLMLPTFYGLKLRQYALFPGDPPLWSLFFEMVINMLWALVGIRLRTWALATFALASWVVVAFLAIHFHTGDIGFNIRTFWAGMARVCFSFPLGVVIYRLHLNIRLPSFRTGPLFLGLLLLVAFSVPSRVDAGGVPWFDLACLLALLPAVVVLGTAHSAGSRSSILLGNLSYPVYVLHFPVLFILFEFHRSTFPSVNRHVFSVVSVMLILLLAACALRFYDEPARRILSNFAASLITRLNQGSRSKRLRRARQLRGNS